MKAKIKGTPFEVDVQLHYDSGQFMGFIDTETHSLLYNPEDLEFEKEFDWDAYRREVAKDLLAGMVAHEMDRRVSLRTSVDIAIDYANELIRELKKEEE